MLLHVVASNSSTLVADIVLAYPGTYDLSTKFRHYYKYDEHTRMYPNVSGYVCPACVIPLLVNPPTL